MSITPITKNKLSELEKLEKVICAGLNAYDQRNKLIHDLVLAGTRQADVTRHLNAVRQKMGTAPLTPDAVAATVKRVADRSS